ncbi:MAG TPA: antibiotic biosynthesis monooxygenase [Tepidisphaeraceae bacterium]
MGHFVIVTYRPKPGKEKQLLEAVRDHMPVLRSQKLVTDRPAYAMRAGDGTIVEVFEWKSKQAVEAAHSNPEVGKLWKRFDECCTFQKLMDLAEAKETFPHFEPIEL